MRSISYEEYMNLHVDDTSLFKVIYNRNSERIGLIVSGDILYRENDLLQAILDDYPPMISFNTFGDITVHVTFDDTDDLYLYDINDIETTIYEKLYNLYQDYCQNDDFARAVYCDDACLADYSDIHL